MGEAGNEFEFAGGDYLEGTAFENPIVKIIRGYSVSDETVRNIRDSDIQQGDLAALSDDDLQRFGIESADVRREMLSQFANSPNQLLHYDKYIAEMELDKYHETVYKNVHGQLQIMNKVLKASQKVLKPIEYDKLVDDNVYVSSLTTKAMREILKTISHITNTTESNRWNTVMLTLAGLSLLGSLVAFRKVMKL